MNKRIVRKSIHLDLLPFQLKKKKREDTLYESNLGAKPAAVDLSGSYSGRKKRSENNLHGLVPEVATHAVKIKSRGKHGNLAHDAQDGAVPSRSVFESLKYGRRKRSNSISFAEYDKERVKTLKIEQNDALALPQRLKDEAERSERQKRKF